MANRSYLYSTNHFPGSPEWSEKKAFHGISEFRYDIPLVFKILLTGNPTTCRSSIWESQEQIAIAGDYSHGLENLTRYLDRITDSAARPLIDEAIRFLSAPEQARKYFVLESGEIFDLTEGSLAEKNIALLAEIREMSEGIERLPTPLPVRARQGLLARLFRLTAPDPRSPYHEIGLGAWSEILYFDFSQGGA